MNPRRSIYTKSQSWSKKYGELAEARLAKFKSQTAKRKINFTKYLRIALPQSAVGNVLCPLSLTGLPRGGLHFLCQMGRCTCINMADRQELSHVISGTNGQSH